MRVDARIGVSVFNQFNRVPPLGPLGRGWGFCFPERLSRDGIQAPLVCARAASMAMLQTGHAAVIEQITDALLPRANIRLT